MPQKKANGGFQSSSGSGGLFAMFSNEKQVKTKRKRPPSPPPTESRRKRTENDPTQDDDSILLSSSEDNGYVRDDAAVGKAGRNKKKHNLFDSHPLKSNNSFDLYDHSDSDGDGLQAVVGGVAHGQKSPTKTWKSKHDTTTPIKSNLTTYNNIGSSSSRKKREQSLQLQNSKSPWNEDDAANNVQTLVKRRKRQREVDSDDRMYKSSMAAGASAKKQSPKVDKTSGKSGSRRPNQQDLLNTDDDDESSQDRDNSLRLDTGPYIPLFQPDGTGKTLTATNLLYVVNLMERQAKDMLASRTRHTTREKALNLKMKTPPHIDRMVSGMRKALRSTPIPSETYGASVGGSGKRKSNNNNDPWGDQLLKANLKRTEQIKRSSRVLDELRRQKELLTQKLTSVEENRDEVMASLECVAANRAKDKKLDALHPELKSFFGTNKNSDDDDDDGASNNKDSTLQPRKFRPPPPGSMKQLLEKFRSMPTGEPKALSSSLKKNC